MLIWTHSASWWWVWSWWLCLPWSCFYCGTIIALWSQECVRIRRMDLNRPTITQMWQGLYLTKGAWENDRKVYQKWIEIDIFYLGFVVFRDVPILPLLSAWYQYHKCYVSRILLILLCGDFVRNTIFVLCSHTSVKGSVREIWRVLFRLILSRLEATAKINK